MRKLIPPSLAAAFHLSFSEKRKQNLYQVLVLVALLHQGKGPNVVCQLKKYRQKVELSCLTIYSWMEAYSSAGIAVIVSTLLVWIPSEVQETPRKEGRSEQ